MLCRSPLRLLHDVNLPNPYLAIKVTGGIRARHGADEHHHVTLVLRLLYGAHLLLPREHLHLPSVAGQVEPRFVDVNRVETCFQRFANPGDLAQDEVYTVSCWNARLGRHR